MSELSAELVRDWEVTAIGLANENERLKYAIRMMCTEMPVHWPDLARAEGWGFVADLVQEVIDGAE